MFIDTIQLSLAGGKGGNGIVSWHRAKYIPKGGPVGGNGGIGGSITIRCDSNIFSLEHLRNKRHIQAMNGISGGKNNRSGKNGENLILKVPAGTIIKDAQSQNIIYDFTKHGDELVICNGGKGGKGNASFKSSKNRAPNYCTLGEEGESSEIILELKLLANIGFIGLPNAGKSTLLSKMAHIKIKIAPYPFTTLRPNIAIMEFEDFSRIIMADIPGIISKAHENKGLGLSFLKHIERTSALLFVIDVSYNEDPIQDFLLLREEIKEYNPKILEKPFIVALNKIDVEGSEHNIKKFIQAFTFDPSLIFQISAMERKGFTPLINAIESLTRKKAFISQPS
jgi:GTP-binding protein